MARSSAVTSFAAFALVWSCLTACGQERHARCADLQEQWRDALSRLTAATEALGAVKEESLAPLIENQLRHKPRDRTIAETVQLVLRDRRSRMIEPQTDVESLARTETSLFERFKMCLSSERRRPHGERRSQFAERERIRERVNALLTDEAFLQYKGSREYGPTEYSYGNPGGPAPRPSGNLPAAPSHFGGGNQGWFGRR